MYIIIEKPSSLTAFLNPFVDEMQLLIECGLVVENQNIAVGARCFALDTPARAFVKGNFF